MRVKVRKTKGAMLKKGGATMKTSVKLRTREKSIVAGMAEYTRALRTQSPEQAKLEARKALQRTGVISSNGRLKKAIVSWE